MVNGMHMRTVHYLQCAVCVETFASENELNDHMKSLHVASLAPVSISVDTIPEPNGPSEEPWLPH